MEVGTFQSAEDRPFYEETKKAEVCVSIDWAVPEGSMEVLRECKTVQIMMEVDLQLTSMEMRV